MREIRFRGYHKENGIMVYSDEIRSIGYDWEMGEGNDVEMANLCLNNDEFEWMQFTGLYDRNGWNIYEGDILSTDLSRPYLIVEFRNGAFMYQCHDNGKDYYDLMVPLSFEGTTDEHAEVIGNIYEDSYLIKG